jgi:hypothetical protein
VAESPQEPAPRRSRWIIAAAVVAVAASLGGVAAIIALRGGGGERGGARVEIALPPPAASPGAAPDPGLVEDSPQGKLPIIGKDGREPWHVYARHFDAADRRPVVAIVITGLGLDQAATREAMDRLPPAVTLAFSPYARDLAVAIAAARKAGHEVLLGLPMEPSDYPRRDPGPETLLTSLDAAHNLARLAWVMSRGSAYVGLVAIMGDRFAVQRDSLEPVLEALKKRGLLYVDNHAAAASAAGDIGRDLGLAIAVADRRLDGEAGAAAIDQALTDLETVATQDGAALGLGAVYHVTLDRVIAWAPTLDKKGVALAPVSAIIDRRHAPAKPAP